jgi:hypothetical protein
VNAPRTTHEVKEIEVSDTVASNIARAVLDRFDANAVPHSTTVSDWRVVKDNKVYACSVDLNQSIADDQLQQPSIRNYKLQLSSGNTSGSGLQPDYVRVVGFGNDLCKGIIRRGAPADGANDFVAQFTR